MSININTEENKNKKGVGNGMNKRIRKKLEKKQYIKNYKTMELGNIFFGNSRGTYPVERSWGKVFKEFLDVCNIDGYGFYEGTEGETERGGFENEVFKVNPYYWGDDVKIAVEPNFVYKPSNFELDWYKYPMRDSYMNKKITYGEFKNILKKCKESVK